MIIYKGNIIDAPRLGALRAIENGYIGIEKGKVLFCESSLPEEYQNHIAEDLGDKLIIPGFADVHVHAPQWCNAGLGFSLELLPWLQKYTFPAEVNFEDKEFAQREYEKFVRELLINGTTRAVIFGSRHLKATKILIEILRKSGMGAYVGKVNMDRNSIPQLQEATGDSISETLELIQWMQETDPSGSMVKYILTPRYVPCTTEKLMKALGKMGSEYDLPLQSHLDENRDEIEWVRRLHPEQKSFTDVYENYGLLRQGKTIMAHCVHMTEEEQELLKEREVMIAHCAVSNANLASGIMPLRRYLDKGLKVAIASDVGAGQTLSMPHHIVETIRCSKLHWCMNPEEKPISFAEAFYLATKAGGSFFGKVGSFEEGYDFDALIIDDEALKAGMEYSLEERLERFVYVGDSSCIVRRFVAGRECETGGDNR